MSYNLRSNKDEISTDEPTTAQAREGDKNESVILKSSQVPSDQHLINSQLSGEEMDAILEAIKEIKILCSENKKEIEELREEKQRMITHVSNSLDETRHHNHEGTRENSAVAAESVQKKKIYDLPTYTGRPEEWPLFFANFNDTTRIFGYGNRKNLMRLQKCFLGAAREAVVSLLIYPNDVPTAIEELKFSFGRSDLTQLTKL